MQQLIEIGVPYFMLMEVPFTAVANENKRGVTKANNNQDVQVRFAASDLKQAQVQFSLQGGRTPTLWSNEKLPILSLLGYSDGVWRPADFWSKPFFLRHGRSIEAQFLNAGGEEAGKVVFVCDQPAAIATTISVDLENNGEMLVLGVDSKFTNTASEIKEEPTATKDWDFLLLGFYSDLLRADIQIRDVENRNWMSEWTPVWALAGNQSSAIPVRMLKRPYVIPAQRSMTFQFRNHATEPETSGKIWLYGQRLQRQA